MKNVITPLSGPGTVHIAVTGEVVIHSVEIPVTTINTITFRSTAATPVTYFILPAATVAGNYEFDSAVGNGLDVIAAGADAAIITTAS